MRDFIAILRMSLDEEAEATAEELVLEMIKETTKYNLDVPKGEKIELLQVVDFDEEMEKHGGS